MKYLLFALVLCFTICCRLFAEPHGSEGAKETGNWGGNGGGIDHLSDRITHEIKATEKYREKVKNEREQLLKKERELNETTSTAPSQKAQDEMDAAPIASKGTKRDTMIDAANKMTDQNNHTELEKVRGKLNEKTKELAATEKVLSGMRDREKKEKAIEAKEARERAKESDVERRTRESIDKYNRELERNFDRTKTG